MVGEKGWKARENRSKVIKTSPSTKGVSLDWMIKMRSLRRGETSGKIVLFTCTKYHSWISGLFTPLIGASPSSALVPSPNRGVSFGGRRFTPSGFGDGSESIVG